MAYAVVGSEVNRMFGSIAERYDVTNSVLSMGIHHLWRAAFLRMLPQSSASTVLDLCTGTGVLLPALARRCGKVIGSDFCMPMLRHAVGRSGAASAPLVQSDALAIPFADNSFDAITVAFGVRNLERLEDGLREMRRTLKPGGVLLVLEFGQPRGVIAPFFKLYSRAIMPMIGGLLTGNREAYSYLPRTAAAFPCGDDFVAIARAAGFREGSYRVLTGGIAYSYRLER